MLIKHFFLGQNCIECYISCIGYFFTWLTLSITTTIVNKQIIHSHPIKNNVNVYILKYLCIVLSLFVAAITILYRNTKVKVRSPDGDTEYFDIVAGVLQGDTLARYLFIICLDYVLRTSIDKIRENGFELTKKRSRSTLQKQLPTPTTPIT